MAMQTPAHIDTLTWLSRYLAAELAMAGLTVHPGSDMGPVIEIHKIRQDKYRHPLNGLIIFNRIRQLLLVLILDGYLLVAAPALCLRG